ncbi:MAG: chemotaxis protein CheD [Deltaproteobacteria bacterium]|nr:chemotaxis protein CheD [Deltaproteobacteria bacterium]
MLKTKIIVDVSDAKVSNDQADVIATYSLGSCIAVCLYDQATQIGGMLHYQLPDSKLDPQRAEEKPFMFADTGMKILVEKLLSIGANKKRMQIKIAGGSETATGPKGFDIGKRNYLAIRKILWKNGMFIDAEDIGGSSARSVYLDIGDGSVIVKADGVEKTL